MSYPFVNLCDLLSESVKQFPEKMALAAKKEGVYVPLTYRVLSDRVRGFARYLSSVGVRPSDRVALLSHNSPDWVMADLAVLGLGGVVVPIYPTLSLAEIAYILNDCGAVVLIVESQDWVSRMEEIRSSCSALTTVICLADLVCDFSSGEMPEAWGGAGPDDLASIVYTSGTTGNPKGVQLSHGNFLSNVLDGLSVFSISEKDVVLSFLPLSHVFERTAGYYMILAVSGSIYYAESIETVAANLLEVRPTILISVPRLYEKIQAKILSEARGVKKWILKWALLIGKAHVVFLRQGVAIPFLLRVQYGFADELVFSKVRGKTGGRLRFFVSGGAPLGKELGEFFEAMGLLICEGYGMTESAPIIAANRVGNYKFGTVGLAFPSVEVKLGEDQELLVRGPNVMKGYWHLPKETAEVLDAEGWLHTGDIARIDLDGFISIVDRKKELIVLSNGKKVAPQVIEGKLRTSVYISQVMVHGERRSYLTALIVPNFDALRQAGVASEAAIKTLFEKEIIEKSRVFAPFETVKKFIVLKEEFSTENGELTVSLKLRRKVILARYQTILDALYD
ncbi:MAG: long-chain fatty acid--CoA ligase [Candidatus Margulisbacteria bacterium]|nr:long-chain fatty acid--CoA ligase [Candidatus Margulisiibacteriota bacterium]